MPTAIIASQIQIGGTQMNASNTLTGNAQESYRPTDNPVAAEAGTLSTRTDADSGVVGLTDTPTMTAADKVMAIWEEAGVRKSRTNMAVTDVTVNDVTINGGDGDDLPIATTIVSLAIQTDMAASFDGDNLVAIAATATRDATLVFYDAAGTVLLKVELYAGSAWFWQADSNSACPITGNPVAKLSIGNRDTTGAVVLDLGLLHDV